MICSDQEFVKELNKIIFEFIWRGKDKVLRSVLIGDTRDGGLKAPHLNSMIETQRTGKLILGCSFDVKMLPIKLPPFYEDCLKSFAKCQWQLINAKNLLMI